MKKILCGALAVLISFTLILPLVACGVSLADIRALQLSKSMSEDTEKATEMSTEIVRCFSERDKESFKGLFCEQTRNRPDFDTEIDNAFEFLQCDSYNTAVLDANASGGESITSGTRTSWYVRAEIPYLKVWVGDELRYYAIDYYWFILDDADTTKVGLHYMEIELLNVDSIVIGKVPWD